LEAVQRGSDQYEYAEAARHQAKDMDNPVNCELVGVVYPCCRFAQ
jgi:hypothetical protein